MDGSIDEDLHEESEAQVCALDADVHARVCALELRVQSQEDELTVLKAALADVIRRLSQSEESKRQSKGSMREAYSLSCLPNGGGAGSTHGPSRGSTHGRRRDRESGSVTRKETLSSAAKSGTEKRKESLHKSQSRADLDQTQDQPRGGSSRRSLDRDDDRLHRVASTSKVLARVAKQAHRSKDPVVSPAKMSTREKTKETQAEGNVIKMFMRGRPITMFIPSDVENYNDMKTELPPERLKLEWAYPSVLPDTQGKLRCPHNTPHSTSHSTPRSTPHNTPRSTSHNTPRSTPHNTPRSTSHNTPRSTPHNTPRSTPHNTPQQYSSQHPSQQYSSQHPSQYSSQHPSQYSSQHPSQYSSQHPSQYSSQHPSQYSSQHPSQYSSQHPSQYSSQHPSQYFSQYPSQYSSQYPSQYSSQHSSQYSSQHPSQYSSQHPSQYSSQYSSQYGYRGRDCRANVFLLPTGETVYFIASVVVLFNSEERTQRHYIGHSDCVKCLALHPDKIRVATGQIAGVDKDGRALAPHVRVWDSVSLSTLQVVGQGTFERGVGSLAFSKADSGVHLAVVDDCNDHMLTVWDWNRKQKVAEIKTTNELVLGVEFHPTDSASIVTCGKSHIFFWTWNNNSLQRKQGIFGKLEKPKFVQCVAFLQSGDILTGDSGGALLVWSRTADTASSKGLRAYHITRQVKAHEGSVFCLSDTRGGAVLSGGSKDRRVVLWDHSLRAEKEMEVPEAFGSIRAVAEGKGDEVLVGTSKNFILRGTFTEGFTVEVQGHTDELWGLASHPSADLFLTCAQDRLVCLWDAREHRLRWSRSLEEHGHCAEFHPSGNVVVIGTHSGKWYVLDAETTDLVAIHTDGNEQLSVLRFSTDGSLLAVGSHDNFIYLYTVSENGRKYNRYNKCSGHSSYITHLDWSPDNSFIMSNSGDYEILYWDVVNGCSQIRNRSDCKDIDWATYTCVLGFHVFGVWPEGSDGTDINALVRSHNRRVIALADDFCKVHLFSYPCSTPKAPSHKYSAHSSHVTNVSFLFADSHLISTGGKDTSVLQWRLVESSTGPAPKAPPPVETTPTANGEPEPALTPPTSDTLSLMDSLEPTPPLTPPS
uniref:Echinoderm microtubule-associated protein-like 4 n=1 Tax=Knipowitschia caucasica TaxID=637954 RepID=A0AAV2JLP6_KNICA